MRDLENNSHRGLNLDLIQNVVFALVLFLYPMRHIHWGLDFWDTGYNYANFIYMGLEHMDSMWLFSTYLANVVGHFLTLLPGAGGLLGMNFYTGLFVSGLAVGGYFFCTGELGISKWIAFVGEMAAISLCWCPTSLLYNYITYVFFSGCVVLLYLGLTKEKRWCLFAAGVCLGCNVLVRFSNLPEAAMIVAVWAWDLILWLEQRGKRKNADKQVQVKAEADLAEGMAEESITEEKVAESIAESGDTEAGKAWKNGNQGGFGGAVRHTLWCLGGYVAALLVLYGYIQIKYGLDSYVEGIRRLFAMTEEASDYTAKAMIMGLIGTYVENLYWAVRIGVIVVVGVIGFFVMERLFLKFKAGERAKKIVLWVCRIGWCGVAALMIGWLFRRGFCSLLFYTYGPMERPAVLFLMLAMGIGAIRIFHPASPKEEKLISGMVILVVLLTSIGSNNRVFPSINHLFIVGPYTLWECWKFLKCGNILEYGQERQAGNAGADGGEKIRRDFNVSFFPVKVILVAFLALFLFQSTGFGIGFVFAEGTGEQNITTVVENNAILKHIKMNPERAEKLGELNEFVNGNGLQGREVLLFGQLPSLSYYLQMPSAFNPWSDLRSYSYETMRSDLEAVAEGMETGMGQRPVVIMDRQYVRDYEDYLEGGEELLQERGVELNQVKWIADTEKKYQLIKEFTERYNYDLTFENERFLVLE